MANLPYDKHSAASIFEYSKGLLGKSLRAFVREDYLPKKGKGSIGQMVENLYFLLETNNNPEADFSSANMPARNRVALSSGCHDYLHIECCVLKCPLTSSMTSTPERYPVT